MGNGEKAPINLSSENGEINLKSVAAVAAVAVAVWSAAELKNFVGDIFGAIKPHHSAEVVDYGSVLDRLEVVDDSVHVVGHTKGGVKVVKHNVHVGGHNVISGFINGTAGNFTDQTAISMEQGEVLLGTHAGGIKLSAPSHKPTAKLSKIVATVDMSKVYWFDGLKPAKAADGHFESDARNDAVIDLAEAASLDSGLDDLKSDVDSYVDKSLVSRCSGIMAMKFEEGIRLKVKDTVRQVMPLLPPFERAGLEAGLKHIDVELAQPSTNERGGVAEMLPSNVSQIKPKEPSIDDFAKTIHVDKDDIEISGMKPCTATAVVAKHMNTSDTSKVIEPGDL